jgi:dynein heavy chain 1
MGDSLEGGTGDGPPETENVAVVEYSTFATFLKKAVTILLPEDEDVIPPALNSALNDRNNQDCIHKFLSDPQVSCLFVQRISSKGMLIFCCSADFKFTLCLSL